MRGGFGVKEGERLSRPAKTASGLNKPLTNWLLDPYRNGRHLDSRGLPVAREMNAVKRRWAERGIVSMTVDLHEQSLWLIPVSLAVGFMVWVLWNWWREERRIEGGRQRGINQRVQPAPSSEALDWHRRGRPILH